MFDREKGKLKLIILGAGFNTLMSTPLEFELLKGFTLTLQQTRSIHGSMNIPKIELMAYFNILL